MVLKMLELLQKKLYQEMPEMNFILAGKLQMAQVILQGKCLMYLQLVIHLIVVKSKI